MFSIFLSIFYYIDIYDCSKHYLWHDDTDKSTSHRETAVSFFTQPTPPTQQPAKQQPTQPPKQQPTQQPTIEQKQQPLQVENTTEVEEMHIGLNEYMEGAPKAKKTSEKQLLHLAKMRQQKALKG